jgi:hypothetical protein
MSPDGAPPEERGSRTALICSQVFFIQARHTTTGKRSRCLHDFVSDVLPTWHRLFRESSTAAIDFGQVCFDL